MELLALGCGPMEGEQHFLMSLPTRDLALGGLASLQLLEGDVVKGEKAVATPTALEAPEATLLSNGRVRITWDAAAHEGLMVRHPETGEALAILAGGQGDVLVDAQAITHLDLIPSGAREPLVRRTPVKR